MLKHETANLFKAILFFLFLFTQNATAADLCGQMPDPIKQLSVGGYYTDKNYSIIDEERQDEFRQKVSPISDFQNKISQFSDEYLFENNTQSAACAIDWLEKWAKEDAMLCKMKTGQAGHVRQWFLSSVAMSYLKVQKSADKQSTQIIEIWLSKLADKVIYYTEHELYGHNNHLYYSGLGIMAVGIATNNVKYIDKARDIFKEALSVINEDGALPAEMSRASKSLIYHNYALNPLFVMAALSKKIGENWYKINDYKIYQVADFVIRGNLNPEIFEEITGHKQQKAHGNLLSWIAFYNKQNNDIKYNIDSILVRRPFVEKAVGGNLTKLIDSGFFDSK